MARVKTQDGTNETGLMVGEETAALTGAEAAPPAVATGVETTSAVQGADNEVLRRFPEHEVLTSPTPEDKLKCWQPGRTAEEVRYMLEKYQGRYAQGPAGDVIAID